MRILFGSCRYYPIGGGAENTFMNVVNMASRSNEVMVITQELTAKIEKGEYLDLHKNRVTKFKYLFQGGEFWSEKINKKVEKEVLNFVKKYKPDVIHGNFLNHFTFILSSVAKKLDIPYVQTVCGSDIYLFPIKKDIRKMSSITLRQSSFIIAKSKDLKSALGRRFKISKDKVSVISNSVDINRHKTKKEEDYIVWVGKIKWVKGVDFLCAIAEMIQKLNPKIKIYVIGDGEDTRRIRSFIEARQLDNLFILGQQSRDKTKQYIRQSKFLIITSFYEGCSNVVLEAFTKSKPVIGFNTFGVRNLVKNNERGILVDCFDLKDFARKTNKLFCSKTMRDCLGDNALVYVRENHNLQLFDSIFNIYKKLNKNV